MLMAVVRFVFICLLVVVSDIIESTFQPFYEVVGHGFGEAQGRKKTENVC